MLGCSTPRPKLPNRSALQAIIMGRSRALSFCDLPHCKCLGRAYHLPLQLEITKSSNHSITNDQDHHRALPHQERRADPLDHPRAARRTAARGALQPVPAARRRRADRPAHRLRHRRHVHRAVGGDDAGRRKLRRQPELRPLPRLRAGHLRLPARDPHPPGPRRRAHPVPRDVQEGRRGAEQHALRHHARQHRVRRRRGRGPADPGRAPARDCGIPSRATWMSARWRS